MANFAGYKSAPLDEILQLHQNIHLLGPGIQECFACCTNNDVMVALLDGLAILCTLYEAARIRYSEASAPGGVTCDTCLPVRPAARPFPDSAAPAEKTGEGANGHHEHSTPKSVSNTISPVVLGRTELPDSERNLVALVLIKQGLSQTGSHLRDLQQHLTKTKTSNYDIYKRRVGEMLSGTYSSLACI